MLCLLLLLLLGITIIYYIVFLISWHFSCIFPDALGKNSKKVSAVISWGECRQLPQPRGMHHSSLQDWWHAGPSGLRRKRTQEGRVDIFWDALQRWFFWTWGGWRWGRILGIHWKDLKELMRSLQNLFIILSLSATFRHFQALSPQIRCPKFMGSWGIIFRACWLVRTLCTTPRSDNRRVRKSIPRCLDSAWSGWLPCNFSTRVGCPVYRII